ncbi:MAG TPA: O-antigen ligase family protein [Thermoleophilaceae bacterium]|nr:O-antigen ligase family protein [Thermoleophilaceae bacterium]
MAALLALPGALLVYLSFNGGGYFVGAPAVAAIVVAGALLIRVIAAERPFAGLNRAGAAVAAALALLAVWTLLSASWSDAPARATLEFDRTLLYLLTFLLLACVAGTRPRLAWLVRLLALAIFAVCTAALTTRLAPELWPTSLTVRPERLRYPLTYWNALGMLASIGVILCFHLAASLRQAPWVRVVASAAVPALAVTLYLTLSRGAIAAGAVALLVYIVLGRPSGLISTLAAAVPTSAFAVVMAYGAEQLTGTDPTGPAAISEGQDVALALGLATVAAGAIRFFLFRLDRRLLQIRIPAARRPAFVAGGVLASGLIALVAFLALGGPGYMDRQYERFVKTDAADETSDARSRLTNPGNKGRLEHWEVALAAFRETPLQGSGAGTYQLEWAQRRQTEFNVVDGHSLYLEMLGELGLVGLALLAVAVLTILAVLAARSRGPNRSLHAAVFAAALAWALHTGVDWDWEVPALTILFFALAGAGLAAPEGEGGLRIAPSRIARALVAVGIVIVAITPARAALSQHHLNRGVEALRAGDCARAIDAGLAARAALPVRPEPWEVIGYCEARLRKGSLAVDSLERAVRRDPENSQLHLGLALVRGAARLDPRPAARRALRLNPFDVIARDAVRRFRTDDPARWEREARSLPLPLY